MDNQNLKVLPIVMMGKKCEVNIFDNFFILLNGKPPVIPVSSVPVFKFENHLSQRHESQRQLPQIQLSQFSYNI
jgi:hypothetical protein